MLSSSNLFNPDKSFNKSYHSVLLRWDRKCPTPLPIILAHEIELLNKNISTKIQSDENRNKFGARSVRPGMVNSSDRVGPVPSV